MASPTDNAIWPYVAVVKHYVRTFMALVSKSAVTLVGFFAFMVGLIYAGLAVTPYVGVEQGRGKPPLDLETFLPLVGAFLPLFFMFGLVMFMVVFFHETQRKEMISRSVFPVPSTCFALMKIMDVTFNYLFLTALAAPGIVVGFFNCRSLVEVCFVAAAVLFAAFSAIASCLIPAVFWAACGWLYVRLPRRKIRFGLFQALFLSIAIWCIGALCYPMFAMESVVYGLIHGMIDLHASMAWSVSIYLLFCVMVLAAIAGMVAFTLVAIARLFVDEIERLNGVLTVEAEVSSSILANVRLVGNAMRPELAICVKDLCAFFRSSSEVLLLLAVCLLGAFGMVLEYVNPRNLTPILEGFVAEVAVPLFACFYNATAVYLWGFEAKDGASLAAFPVSIKSILKGKTLSLLVLQLPLILGYLVFLCWGGFSFAEFWRWAFFCSWLIPYSLMGVLQGAYMNVSRGKPLDFGAMLIMFLLIFPISGMFLAGYAVTAVLSRSLHWVVLPFSCVAMIILFFSLLDNLWTVIPWLRRWGIYQDQETRLFLFRKRLQKAFSWGIPLLLLFTYIGGGELPFRLLPPLLKIASVCAAVALAVVLFWNGLRKIWRVTLYLAGCIALLAGVTYRLQGSPWLEDVFRQLEPLTTKAFLASHGDKSVLSPEVCKRLGLPEGTTPQMVIDFPPLQGERLERFVKFYGAGKIDRKFMEHNFVGQWLKRSFEMADWEFQLKLWRDAFQSSSVVAGYKSHICRLTFSFSDDWPQNLLHIYLRDLVQSPSRSSSVDSKLPLKRLSPEQVKDLENSFLPPTDSELKQMTPDPDDLLSGPCEFLRCKILLMLPYGGGYAHLQNMLMDRRAGLGRRVSRQWNAFENTYTDEGPVPMTWERMPPPDELVQADAAPDLARMKELCESYPQYAQFVLRKHPVYGDSPDRFAKAMPTIQELDKDAGRWLGIVAAYSDDHIRAYVVECGGPEAIEAVVKARETAEDGKERFFDREYDAFSEFRSLANLVCLDSQRDYDDKELARMLNLTPRRSPDTIRRLLGKVWTMAEDPVARWYPMLSKLSDDEFLEANRKLLTLGVPADELLPYHFPKSPGPRKRIEMICRLIVESEDCDETADSDGFQRAYQLYRFLNYDPALQIAFLRRIGSFDAGAKRLANLLSNNSQETLQPYEYRDHRMAGTVDFQFAFEALSLSRIKEGEGRAVRADLYCGHGSAMHLLPLTFDRVGGRRLPNMVIPLLLTALFLATSCLLFVVPGFRPSLSTVPVKQIERPFPNFAQGVGMVVGYGFGQLLLMGLLLFARGGMDATLTPQDMLLPFALAGALVICFSAHLSDVPTKVWLPLKKPGWRPLWLSVTLALSAALILGPIFIGMLEVLPPSWKMWAEETAQAMPLSGKEGVVIVVILAPVIEELLFRGLMLPGFVSNYGERKALILSALLFAVSHGNPFQFAAAFPLGLVLGYVRLRSGSLTLCILMHTVYNFAVIAVLPWIVAFHPSGLVVTAGLAAIVCWGCLRWFAPSHKSFPNEVVE